MSTLSIIAYFLIAWGVATGAVALIKPGFIWSNAKVQGFIQLLSETGTVVFFLIVGIAAIIGGVVILFNA